jgi:hypothetical protein
MTTPGTHNDTYAESFHRDFFKNWAAGVPPEKCAEVCAAVTWAVCMTCGAGAEARGLLEVPFEVRRGLWTPGARMGVEQHDILTLTLT